MKKLLKITEIATLPTNAYFCVTQVRTQVQERVNTQINTQFVTQTRVVNNVVTRTQVRDRVIIFYQVLLILI